MSKPSDLPKLTDAEREVYSWQTTVAGFGEEGQRRLKAATVMVSRIGGVGGLVAYELAAVGVGRLVLAHAGKLKPSDLNRQLLMRHDALGQARIDTAVESLKALNPRIEIVAVPGTGPEANAAKYAGAEAGFQACARAVMTLGGMGYAKEFHVERLLREVLICRIAPVSPQLILCHIAEKVLNLPKSY